MLLLFFGFLSLKEQDIVTEMLQIAASSQNSKQMIPKVRLCFSYILDSFISFLRYQELFDLADA